MELPPDMVLFDCDGVLVDSEPLTADVLCRNLARHGVPLTLHQLSEMFLGGTIMDVEARAKELGADLAATWVDDVYQEIFAALDAAVEPIPGIFALLDRLDGERILCAVGSNGPHRKMEITLTRTGLAERFGSRVYSREDVARPKPAPDVYLKAAAEAGVAPARCVVIEDSATGARAAKAAGMYCLGFAAYTEPSRLTPVCDALFTSMDNVPALLGLGGRP
jgi:HAD superfamily hydrolase (TIGR01509 family)